MSIPTLSQAAMRIVDWLAELGPRWGLPGNACRVHALLYLLSRPVPATAIAAVLMLDTAETESALAWLAQEHLAAETPQGWTTGADPWGLMMQALDARRTRELTPARELLRAWQQGRQGEDPVVARQAARLFDLVENIAAIDAGAARLSPDAMRRLVGVGGRAARLVNRTFGKRGGR